MSGTDKANPNFVPVKVTSDTFHAWLRDPNHFHQRLGQYLMNTLLPTVSNSDIFYEENVREALRKFYVFTDDI